MNEFMNSWAWTLIVIISCIIIVAGGAFAIHVIFDTGKYYEEDE